MPNGDEDRAELRKAQIEKEKVARAITDEVYKHGERAFGPRDEPYVGHVGWPAPDHPSPHAARDKTEEWDMRKGAIIEANPDKSYSVIGQEEKVQFEKDIVEKKSVKTMSYKETNPKDSVGIRKWRVFTTVPFTIIWELGVAMMEGSRKYGRHNYRVAGVRGSVYIDAAMGHLTQWWEGEDNDLDTGLSHITKAMASLCVLRDAMIQNKFVDDRPPKTDVAAVRAELQARMDEVFERIPVAKDAYLEGDQYEDAPK